MEITPELLNDVYQKEELNISGISGTQGIENSHKRKEALEHTYNHTLMNTSFWGYRSPDNDKDITPYHEYISANELIEGTPEHKTIAQMEETERRSKAAKLAHKKRNSPEAIQAREDAERLHLYTKEEEEEYQKVRSYMMEEFLSDEEEIKKEAQEIANQHILEIMDELVFL